MATVNFIRYKSQSKTALREVTRYAEQDTWAENLIFRPDAFNLLQNILTEAGELETHVEYDKLVNTTFAEKAAQQ